MTTRSIGPFLPVKDKAGKVKVVRKAPRMPAGQAANAYKKAAREEKAWKERFTPEHERRLKAMQVHLAAKARGKG